MKKLMLTLAIFMPLLTHAGGIIISGGLDDRAIEVSFLSKGDGIDEAAKEKLLNLVKEGLGQDTIVAVTAKKQGFEGDVTYCVEFLNSNVMSENFSLFDAIVASAKGVTAFTAPNCTVVK